MKYTFCLLLLLLAACGGTQNHGQASALTANAANPHHLCEHRVPAEVCVLCHPELVPAFKAVNDWCAPHKVPESQCHKCHDLSFEPLPEAPADADQKELTAAEALVDLAQLAVPSKVTVVDFWAVWCVPCRGVAGDLNERLTRNPALAVRKIQVANWDDPIAQKHLKGAQELPLVVVFNAAGKEVGRVSGRRPDRLDVLLAEAAGP